jgi:F-type H+-transporting ATPase subunit epsilon
MAERLLFELVSPERLLLSEEVDMVVVPGSEGNFGVLKGHSLLISTLRPGVIDVYEGQVVTDRIFVAGGFAEVTPERCTVLADEAVAVTDLDATAVEANLRQLEGAVANLRESVARLAGAERDAAARELAQAERDHAAAEAKLAAVRERGTTGATTH